MTESVHIKMSIADLLAWASSETRLADLLEDNTMEFSILAGAELQETIAKHRARSRWLDEQVAKRLDAKDPKKEEDK